MRSSTCFRDERWDGPWLGTCERNSSAIGRLLDREGVDTDVAHRPEAAHQRSLGPLEAHDGDAREIGAKELGLGQIVEHRVPVGVDQAGGHRPPLAIDDRGSVRSDRAGRDGLDMVMSASSRNDEATASCDLAPPRRM